DTFPTEPKARHGTSKSATESGFMERLRLNGARAGPPAPPAPPQGRSRSRTANTLASSLPTGASPRPSGAASGPESPSTSPPAPRPAPRPPRPACSGAGPLRRPSRAARRCRRIRDTAPRPPPPPAPRGRSLRQRELQRAPCHAGDADLPALERLAVQLLRQVVRGAGVAQLVLGLPAGERPLAHLAHAGDVRQHLLELLHHRELADPVDAHAQPGAVHLRVVDGLVDGLAQLAHDLRALEPRQVVGGAVVGEQRLPDLRLGDDHLPGLGRQLG